MKLGKVVATPSVVEHCEKNNINILEFIRRHELNDWGDLGDDDKHANNMEMFATAGHVLSKFNLKTGLSIYVETNWNEQERYTVACFPEER